MEAGNETGRASDLPLSCIKCGRQDKTLRAVAYPFAFSLVFVTFRRTFAGVWCAKHRRPYLLLASLITASVGWFGIPYGLVYTPVILFLLAKGGLLDPGTNFQLLTALAERKLLTGDEEGAIACFEESLRFKESPEVQQRLSTLYLRRRRDASEGFLSSAAKTLAIPGLLIACVLLGSAIGLLDVVIASFLGPLVGSTASIFIAILTWIPLSVMLFFGVLAVRSLTGWSLRKIGSADRPFSVMLALFATLFAWYAILESRALMGFASLPIQSFFLSSRDAIFGARALLAYGGVLEFANNLRLNSTSGLIYDVLWCAGAACSFAVGIFAAQQSARWQTQLAQTRGLGLSSSDRSPALSWALLVGIVAAFAMVAFAVSPGRFVNIEEAYLHFNTGFPALSEGDNAKALTELNQMVEIWPEAAIGHAGLAAIYMDREGPDPALAEAEAALARDPSSFYANFLMAFIRIHRGEFAQAVKNFEVVQAAQPALGFPHAYLAVLYYQLDELELSEREIQLALDREEADIQAASVIGVYYAAKNKFDVAETHLLKATKSSPDATTYLWLARVEADQRKFDLAQDAIDKAKQLGAKPADLYLAKADIFEFQGNFDAAASAISSALQLSPGSSEAHSDLSFVYFQLGRIKDAATEAEKAIAADPHDAYAYVEQAFAYHAQGRLAEALTAAEKGVALVPKYDRAHYILGVSYMENGRKAEAIQEFETFLDLYWERPYAVQYKESAESYLSQLH